MAPQRSTGLLSVAQAASLLGVHPNTIRAWTDAGRLTAYRINARGDRRFRRDDVDRLLVADAPATETAPTHGKPFPRNPELAVIERIASGLTATPSPESVARALVEALRTELHVDRAAVYLLVDERRELVAHAGFSSPPPPDWDERERVAADVDRALPLATRRGPVGIAHPGHGGRRRSDARVPTGASHHGRDGARQLTGDRPRPSRAAPRPRAPLRHEGADRRARPRERCSGAWSI